MSSESIWEWRMFLDDGAPDGAFWSTLDIDTALRARFLRSARERTDVYIDVGDDAIGAKGRAVDANGGPKRLELKVRLQTEGTLERWVKIRRLRPTHPLHLRGIEDARTALHQLVLEPIVDAPPSPPWLTRVSGLASSSDLRLVPLRKRRTRLLLQRNGRGWRVLPFAKTADPDTVQVEHTDLALHTVRGDLQPLGWSLCCEQRLNEPVAAAARELFRGLEGRVMGYPEFVRRIALSSALRRD